MSDGITELVVAIQGMLEKRGLQDLANLENYVLYIDGRPSLPEPPALAVKMLEAFKRHVAMMDHDQFCKSLELIGDASDDTVPEGAIINMSEVSKSAAYGNEYQLKGFDARGLVTKLNRVIATVNESMQR